MLHNRQSVTICFLKIILNVENEHVNWGRCRIGDVLLFNPESSQIIYALIDPLFINRILNYLLLSLVLEIYVLIIGTFSTILSLLMHCCLQKPI